MKTGLANLDRTLQTSNAWLDATAERLHGNHQEAFHALRAVLAAIRDRLPVDVAVNFSAQLPVLIRGIYFDGYQPARVPVKLATREELLDEIRGHLRSAPPIDANRALEAVLDVIVSQMDAGIFEKIAHMLPADLRSALNLEARVEQTHGA